MHFCVKNKQTVENTIYMNVEKNYNFFADIVKQRDFQLKNLMLPKLKKRFTQCKSKKQTDF